jgi:xylan 1,4-beta-xylosidase
MRDGSLCARNTSPLRQPIRMRDRHSSSGRALLLFSVVLLCLLGQLCWSQQTPQGAGISIRVQADQSDGPMSPVWNYFGYDEPNYTYAPNGKRLLGELAALDAAPVYVRVHNLLTTGDGSSSLKWGSTNVYSEDASGHPIYSWVIVDQIFDTFQAANIKPLVEIGFMPKALSIHPEPYRHDFPRTPVSDIYTG